MFLINISAILILIKERKSLHGAISTAAQKAYREIRRGSMAQGRRISRIERLTALLPIKCSVSIESLKPRYQASITAAASHARIRQLRDTERNGSSAGITSVRINWSGKWRLCGNSRAKWNKLERGLFLTLAMLMPSYLISRCSCTDNSVTSSCRSRKS